MLENEKLQENMNLNTSVTFVIPAIISITEKKDKIKSLIIKKFYCSSLNEKEVKDMKRTAVKWYAMALAVMLIGVNMAYQLDSSLSAHEADQATKVEAEAADAAAKNALENAGVSPGGEDSAKALVEAAQQDDRTDDESVKVEVIQ